MRIKCKPLSVNNLYYANKRHGLRADSKDWQRNVFYGLSHYEPELAALRAKFNPKKHGYKVDIEYVFPRQILYNKEGTPSSKAQDLSNCDKALIDCVFLPVHFGNDVPSNCQNLCMDDKHLFELSSKKVPGIDYEIIVEITIINLP